jgi:hypothetical protein
MQRYCIKINNNYRKYDINLTSITTFIILIAFKEREIRPTIKRTLKEFFHLKQGRI